jgi:glucokinase
VSGRLTIGVDVGGTKTAAILLSADGEILHRSTLPTGADDPAASLAAVGDSVEKVLHDSVTGIGVGAAGLIDVRSGTIVFSPNFSWRRVPIAARLTERFGLPVTVDNDATAGAWAEARVGAAAGSDESLFVGVGTGIGGGIVSGGHLLRGANGFAGEIGHVIVQPGGPLCGCGNRGCWEQVASGQALEREGARAITEVPGSAFALLAGGDRGGAGRRSRRRQDRADDRVAPRRGDRRARERPRSGGRRRRRGCGGDRRTDLRSPA